MSYNQHDRAKEPQRERERETETETETDRQTDRQADRASVSLLRRAYGQKWETTLDLTEDLG